MVTYTPAVGWTGQDIFTYTVSDGELTDTATVTVTVNPASANHAPTLHVITPPPTGTVGIHYDFDQIVGLDYDGDALTFSAAGLPAGLRPTQLDQYPGAIKGFIRGTPTSPGTSLVNLSLTDGLITTTTTITITVVAAPIPTGGGQIFLPVVIK
jgi:hypothetical protein